MWPPVNFDHWALITAHSEVVLRSSGQRRATWGSNDVSVALRLRPPGIERVAKVLCSKSFVGVPSSLQVHMPSPAAFSPAKGWG
jgi:hypothetical protein